MCRALPYTRSAVCCRAHRVPLGRVRTHTRHARSALAMATKDAEAHPPRGTFLLTMGGPCTQSKRNANNTVEEYIPLS